MPEFNIKQNDTSPALQATLRDDDGTPIDLTGTTVAFHMAPVNDRSATTVNAAATVTDATGGVVEYEWTPGDTTEPGVYVAEFEATYSDGAVESFPNDGDITVVIVPEVA